MVLACLLMGRLNVQRSLTHVYVGILRLSSDKKSPSLNKYFYTSIPYVYITYTLCQGQTARIIGALINTMKIYSINNNSSLGLVI